jgi:hypothetical protein
MEGDMLGKLPYLARWYWSCMDKDPTPKLVLNGFLEFG